MEEENELTVTQAEENNELTETPKEEKNELAVVQKNEDSGELALTKAIDELAKLLPTLNRWIRE